MRIKEVSGQLGHQELRNSKLSKPWLSFRLPYIRFGSSVSVSTNSPTKLSSRQRTASKFGSWCKKAAFWPLRIPRPGNQPLRTKSEGDNKCKSIGRESSRQRLRLQGNVGAAGLFLYKDLTDKRNPKFKNQLLVARSETTIDQKQVARLVGVSVNQISPYQVGHQAAKSKGEKPQQIR